MTEVAKKERATVAVPSESVQAELDRMLAKYETTDDGQGGARVALALLAAGAPEDLNAPWDTEKWRETLLGHRIRFDTIRPMASDFQDGYGFYLFVSGVDVQTGEAVEFGIGAAMVMVQLLAADDRGWMPLDATIVQGENRKRPDRPWYRLQVHGRAE